MKKVLYIILAFALFIPLAALTGCPSPPSTSPTSPTSPTPSTPSTPPAPPAAEKPVIYLYPAEPTSIKVELLFDGVLDFTYPAYGNGWSVLAYPDGTLVDCSDGKEYSYLFWEGHCETDYDLSKGFVVRGEDTVAFLQDTLSFMGLTSREYNEFIVYWAPRMQDSAYNLIAFQGAAYNDTAQLLINPEPDSILRIFMAFKSLDWPIEIEEQILEPFERTGFVVIEWGGCEVFR